MNKGLAVAAVILAGIVIVVLYRFDPQQMSFFPPCIFKKLTGYDALQKLNTTKPPPDFIFLDLNMPRLNGIEFLSRVKETEHLSDIPVVIYSTSGSVEYRKQTSDMGAVYYMVKQNSFKALCNELNEVLSTPWQ